MPGRILTKIMRSGYFGQVVTAAALLTTAALLLWAVTGTMRQEAERSAADKASALELVQPAPAVLITKLPAAQAAGQELPPAMARPERAAAEPIVIAGAYDRETGQQAIGLLWRGSLLRDFGWQLHPVYRDWRYQGGILIGGRQGQTVPALLTGQVVEVFTDEHYGLTVAVDSGTYKVYYGSMSSVAVHKNALVEPGSTIGTMAIGADGLGPHLYLAVKNSENKVVSPREVFPDIPQ